MYTLLLAVVAEQEHSGIAQMFDVGKSSFYWTLAIFLLALPFMWKMVFGPIVAALEEREDAARESARAAEAAREETERMKAAIQEDLDAARREAANQVAEAKVRASEREQELMSAAKAEAERERARAHREIENSLASAREILRKEAVTLAIDVAERVIMREFSEADQKRLVDDFQSEVAKN
ncbi:MAG: F0F1 ATP synthase subunit B [Planctomycetes bacterium]|nr:F0F1 ATP synthase subunit B [Planctomycetota bacterium]